MEFPGKLLYFSEKIKTKKIKKKQILNVEILKTNSNATLKQPFTEDYFFFCMKTMNTLLLFEYNSIVFFFSRWNKEEKASVWWALSSILVILGGRPSILVDI